MTLTAWLVALLAAQAPHDLVPARAATADELARAIFDPRWLLPDDLPVARVTGSGPRENLVVHMRALLALRADAATEGPRSLGGVVRACLRAGVGARALTNTLTNTQPELARALEPALRELLSTERLDSKSWDPSRDDAQDGIYFAAPLTLEHASDPPWSQIEGSRLVQQACVLVFADLAAIKRAENDYRAYPRRPGAAYESIYPVRGSHVRGVDTSGHPFAALRIHFRCDLPFPYSDYSCDLSIWNRVGAGGGVRCDIHSASRDFLWLAGRDTFLAVHDDDGAPVATLVVRWFGFDLRGVPDGDEARRTALRASLGSLKREAEALARATPWEASVERALAFDVRGGR
ncbi:MAG: hypothetical protein ACKVWV_02835 [Planctomycetota bacterium]